MVERQKSNSERRERPGPQFCPEVWAMPNGIWPVIYRACVCARLCASVWGVLCLSGQCALYLGALSMCVGCVFVGWPRWTARLCVVSPAVVLGPLPVLPFTRPSFFSWAFSSGHGLTFLCSCWDDPIMEGAIQLQCPRPDRCLSRGALPTEGSGWSGDPHSALQKGHGSPRFSVFIR